MARKRKYPVGQDRGSPQTAAAEGQSAGNGTGTDRIAPIEEAQASATLPGPDDEIEVEVKQAESAAPDRAASRIAYRTKKQREAAAAQSSLVMLTMFDGLVSMSLGPECVLQPNHREMIEQPLQRMLQRIDPTITGAIEKYTDPLLVTMGFISWGAYVWQIQLAKMRAARREAERRQATQPAEEAGPQTDQPAIDYSLPPSPGADILGQVTP